MRKQQQLTDASVLKFGYTMEKYSAKHSGLHQELWTFQDHPENVVIVEIVAAEANAEAIVKEDRKADRKVAETVAGTIEAVRKAADKADIIGDRKAADPHMVRVRNNLHRKEATANDITKKSKIPQAT